MSARAIPAGALALGLAGLIPFVAAALAMLAGPPGIADLGFQGFVLYAAVILSFLGGVRWGLEIARAPAAPSTLRLTYAVLPSIGGWALAWWSLSGPDQHGAAAVFAGLFAAQYVWDRRAADDAPAPAWYPALRQILTGGVMLCCLLLIAARALGRV